MFKCTTTFNHAKAKFLRAQMAHTLIRRRLVALAPRNLGVSTSTLEVEDNPGTPAPFDSTQLEIENENSLDDQGYKSIRGFDRAQEGGYTGTRLQWELQRFSKFRKAFGRERNLLIKFIQR
jgi:hypothetical protein